MMYEPDVVSDLDQLRSRYDVLRHLGQDGGRPVYAVRSRGTGRHFVVSVVERPGAGGARRGGLSLWQAHTMEPLSHPRLIPLHAVHHLQDGAVGVAMERRRGRTLAERLAEAGALGAAEAETIFRAVADGLAYLHGRGIAHGRIGAHSIFLDRDAGCARLAAFGIERVETGAVGEGPARAGGRGEGEVGHPAVGPTDDVVALGRLGVAMLLGGTREVEAWARERVPLADLRPDATEALCAVVEACLAERPRHRPRAADVPAWLDGGAPGATGRWGGRMGQARGAGWLARPPFGVPPPVVAWSTRLPFGVPRPVVAWLARTTEAMEDAPARVTPAWRRRVAGATAAAALVAAVIALDGGSPGPDLSGMAAAAGRDAAAEGGLERPRPTRPPLVARRIEPELVPLEAGPASDAPPELAAVERTGGAARARAAEPAVNAGSGPAEGVARPVARTQGTPRSLEPPRPGPRREAVGYVLLGEPIDR